MRSFDLLLFSFITLDKAAMSSNIYLRQERVSALFGRDVCSDAFGPNASNSICAPSNTLCCVRRNQAFPSCQQYLGRGWCCVGEKETENCYIDTPSVCDEPNSVPCTNLASGTKQACCPRLTSCHDPFEASEDQVRCNIRHIDLKNAARAAENTVNSSSTRTSSSTSTTSTSTSSTISTDSLSLSTTSASTGNAANATGTPSPSMSPSSGGGVSAGVIAGAVIGATCFIAALVLLGCFFYRRRAKSGGPKHELPAQGMTSSYSQQHSPYPTIGPYYHEYKPYGAANLPIGPDGYPAVHNAPVEVASTNAGGNYYAAELPTTR